MKWLHMVSLKAIAAVAAVPALCLALTSGPNMPEYNRFEAVEATDLVNMTSGGFSWSLPVMTVPGPGLSFPLTLAYHAGTSVKEEASWVGLGWNLQAGAITRQVNKLPDDFRNVEIIETINSDKIHAWTAAINAGVATVGITYRSDEGYGGFVGVDVAAIIGAFMGAPPGSLPVSVEVTAGWGSASDMSGMAVGLRMAPPGGEALGVGSSAKVSVNGQGASLSVQAGVPGGSVGASLSESGFSINASNPVGSIGMSIGGDGVSMQASVGMFSVGINLTQGSITSVGVGGMTFSQANTAKGIVRTASSGFSLGVLSFSKQSTWIEGLENDHHFGFLYADKAGMSCTGATIMEDVNCHNRRGDAFRKRHELVGSDVPLSDASNARLMRTAEDVYMVSAQGLSGTFKPFRREDGDYHNFLKNTSKLECSFLSCKRVRIDRSEVLEHSSNLLNSRGRAAVGTSFNDNSLHGSYGMNDLYWRFLDDAGGAEHTDPESRDAGSSFSYQSRQIRALIQDDRLTGFEIRNSSGVRYVFGFPLWNVWEFKKGFQDGDKADSYTSQDWEAPYAYAWLLTEILSPDYVDLDRNGASALDVGSWVRMTYGDGSGPGGENKRLAAYWRTPYLDPSSIVGSGLSETEKNRRRYAPASQTTGARTVQDGTVSKSRQSSEGLKEYAYLQKIETPTHYAVFNTDLRDDNLPYAGDRTFNVLKSSNPGFTPSVSFSSFTCNLTACSGNIALNLNLGTDVALSGSAEGPIAKLRPNPIDVEVEYEYTVRHAFGGGKKGCLNVTWSGMHPLNSYVPGTPISTNIKAVAHAAPNNNATSCPSNMNIATIKAVRVRPLYAKGKYSRRLASITLHEKLTGENNEISHVKFLTDYSLSPNTPNSDATGANPNRGRLTLTGLQIGQTSTGPFLPPYAFKYGHNPAYQPGNWVPWENHKWDRWGNLCSECSDAYHEVAWPGNHADYKAWNLSQITMPSGADIMVRYDAKRYQAVGEEPIATNVTIGGITYKKVLVASEGNSYTKKLRTPTNTSPIVPYDTTYESYVMKIQMAAILEKLEKRGLNLAKLHMEISTNQPLAEVAFGSTEERVLPKKTAGDGYTDEAFSVRVTNATCPTGATCSDIDYKVMNSSGERASSFSDFVFFKKYEKTLDYTGSLSHVNTTHIHLGMRLFPSGSVTRVPPSNVQLKYPDERRFSWRMYALVTEDAGANAGEDYAAGAVVTQVDFREPFTGKVQSTKYKYEQGVTVSLPPTFTTHDDSRQDESQGLESFVGSPGVYYGKTTVTFGDGGRSVYHFLTPADVGVHIKTPQDLSNEPLDGSQRSRVEVTDLSGLWGSMWKKEEYDQGNNLVRTSRTYWGYNKAGVPTEASSQFTADLGDILTEYPKTAGGFYDVALNSTKLKSAVRSYFGIQQTLAGHRFFTEGCFVSSGCPVTNIMTTQMVTRRVIPMALRTEITTQGLKNVMHTYHHDFLSGRSLKSRRENSDGSWEVTENIPAYSRYWSMLVHRNMLNQDFARIQYLYPSGERSDFHQAEDPERATAATVSLWRPYLQNGIPVDHASDAETQAYRKHASYLWNANLHATPRPSLVLPEDGCMTAGANSTCYSTIGADWLLEERINRYSSYGFPTEVSNSKGRNSSLLYGYGSALAIAFVENTAMPSPTFDRKFQALAESFELAADVRAKLVNPAHESNYALSPSHAKTGAKSLHLTNYGNSNLNYACFDLGVLEAGKAYEASVWYFDASDGASTSSGTATRPGLSIGSAGGCEVENHPNGSAGGSPPGSGSWNYTQRATGSRQWKRMSVRINKNQCTNQAQLNAGRVCLYASKLNVGAPVFFDELRVAPLGSNMTTYAYNLRGQMISSADINEVVARYEYDILGNMKGIRNDDGVLITEQAKRLGGR